MVRYLILLVSLAMFAPVIHSQTRTSGPTARPAQPKVIKVRKGDTLVTLAELHHVSVDQLAQRNRLEPDTRLRKGQRLFIPAIENRAGLNRDSNEVKGNRITFSDGRTLDVDEVWKLGDVVWYRRGKVTQSLDNQVKLIDPIYTEKVATTPNTKTITDTEPKAGSLQTWIYLIGGARFKVDVVNETAAGAWYNRGNLSIFVEKGRIERISLEDPSMRIPGSRNNDWTTGNSKIDDLIRSNGTRYGVDPYLIFCVIEQESHFHTRALSPKGAQGLMQLMPGTARRFGVSRPYDVSQNIKGGTQYLRELMNMFNGQINLVLASYNAGEGAVMKYGGRVPPYQETREYVRRIGKRYGLSGRLPGQENQIPNPQR